MLNETEIRVLACLVEKELTTPDYYPLTLNSLMHACNQKSNRDPVVAYDEPAVEKALKNLREKNLSTTVYLETGTRVLKHGNNFAEQFKLSRREVAILCELMLRGPQTPGELHTRAERMYPFSSLGEVMEALDLLKSRVPALITVLPRQPGKKEIRYCHLFSGEPAAPTGGTTASGTTTGLSLQERIDHLEKECVELRGRIEALEKELGSFKDAASPPG